MSAPRKDIPEAVTALQARASNPDVSAFVAANAGSGKTHVLVSRVIRLLLNDVKPEKILCITFTKAAAANMAQRVFATLGRWVQMPDDELDAAIPPDRRAKIQCRDPHTGATTVRRRTGNTGRPQGADHSRALHAGCCSNFHSRPTCRRASRCWTTATRTR